MHEGVALPFFWCPAEGDGFKIERATLSPALPRWPPTCPSLSDGTLATAADKAAIRLWLNSGKPWPARVIISPRHCIGLSPIAFRPASPSTIDSLTPAL